MAKFILNTQMSDTATFDGPSGTRYIINRGIPFIVTKENDIDFFSNNHRFTKTGFLVQAPEPIPIPEEAFKTEVSKIKGITKKTKELLVEKYVTKKNLDDDVFENQKYKKRKILDTSISNSQEKIVLKYLNR